MSFAKIIFELRGASLAQYAALAQRMPARFRQEVGRGLGAGGNKARTAVRRALKDQMGVKRYGTIVAATRGYLDAAAMEYVIEAKGAGLPIKEFPVRVTRKGVGAKPWGVTHKFKRSFANNGRLLARRGPSRFPIRALRGPSPALELVKDNTLATFESAVSGVWEPLILARLEKLLG